MNDQSTTEEPSRYQAENGKVNRILEACRIGDLPSLTILATSEYGLINDEIRRVACEI